MDGKIPSLGGQAAAAQDHGAPAAAQAHSAPGDSASTESPSAESSQPRSASRPSIPGEDAFVSPAEIQVLESLTRRREDLDKRAAALDMREKLLVATEQRLDQKLVEIQKVETAIKTSLRTLSEEEAAQIASLVKVYESMKPKEAAAILQGLDRKILIDVAARMKEAKMSAILAAMEPERARELTVLLARRVEIPGLGTTALLGAPKP
jgi:flagellar motility protein MotE (MotC chaperone)